MDSMKIIPLRGPDRIRRRPAVIFGDTGEAGVQEMVNMLLGIFLPQIENGGYKHLTIKRSADDRLTLEGDDPGLYLCDFGKPDSEVWQQMFCLLNVMSRDGYEYHNGERPDLFRPHQGEDETCAWCQLELYSAQCASEFFNVRVRRDGWEHTLYFEKGENKDGLFTAAYDGPSGTCFTFLPDKEVFGQVSLPGEALAAFGRLWSLAHPGLSVTVLDEKLQLEQTFCCPNGILDALTAEYTPVYTAAGYARGKERYDRAEYAANVRLALTFCPEGGAECIHNGRWLPLGGTHLEAFYKKLRRLLEARLDRKLTLKAVKACTKLVLLTDAGQTVWVNGTRKSICNLLLRDMTEDTLEENFMGYVDYHRDLLRKLFR